MDKVQILLIVNSVLLSFLSVMFLIIGYFLKDLHKDFKGMVERVNNLYVEHNTHVTLSKNFDNSLQTRISILFRKVKKLEEKSGTNSKNEKQ
jgi:hypothetical protein